MTNPWHNDAPYPAFRGGSSVCSGGISAGSVGSAGGISAGGAGISTISALGWTLKPTGAVSDRVPMRSGPPPLEPGETETEDEIGEDVWNQSEEDFEDKDLSVPDETEPGYGDTPLVADPRDPDLADDWPTPTPAATTPEINAALHGATIARKGFRQRPRFTRGRAVPSIHIAARMRRRVH